MNMYGQCWLIGGSRLASSRWARSITLWLFRTHVCNPHADAFRSGGQARALIVRLRGSRLSSGVPAVGVDVPIGRNHDLRGRSYPGGV